MNAGILVANFINFSWICLRFEPAGMTDDSDIRMAQSMMDYILRRLALDYLPFESRSAMTLYTHQSGEACGCEFSKN